jgi:signal peptidase II
MLLSVWSGVKLARRDDFGLFTWEYASVGIGSGQVTILRRTVSLLAPLIALVGCDRATKSVAKAALEHRPPRALFGSILDLRYVENTDIAFNGLRWIPPAVRGPLLVAFGALAIGVLLALLLRRTGGRATRASLILILAGALGNYADRLSRGYVVDFIHLPHWPVFNVADICVTVGVILLCWTSGSRLRAASAA